MKGRDKESSTKNSFSLSVGENDLIILCGGLGSRIKPILSGRPKILADLGKETYLDIFLKFLKKQGFKQSILCIGYYGDQVREHCALNKTMNVVFSDEEEPLGTGGAFKKALPLTGSKDIFALSGDILCPINYSDFLRFHLEKNAFASFVLVPRLREDSGSVIVDKNGLILDFIERGRLNESSFMNVGIYIFKKEILSLLPKRQKFSLEHDFFPSLVRDRKCYGYITDQKMIDIGTPERYKEAKERLDEFIV